MKKNALLALLLIPSLVLSACSHLPALSSPVATGPEAVLTFQNGQTATIRITTPDPALQSAFLTWVRNGVYTSAPVYRQLPGIFLLTGKPRLAGNGFVPGRTPSAEESPEARPHQIALVKHTDGTYGPELLLIYGQPVVTCCEAPANVTLGTITEGRSTLNSVQRGDNLLGISILRD